MPQVHVCTKAKGEEDSVNILIHSLSDPDCNAVWEEQENESVHMLSTFLSYLLLSLEHTQPREPV